MNGSPIKDFGDDGMQGVTVFFIYMAEGRGNKLLIYLIARHNALS